jgi:prefoldin subunit 5
VQADDHGSGKARKLVAEIDIIEAIEAIRQSIKDLDAETERLNAAREAMPSPINRATKRRAAKQTAPMAGRLRD